MRLQRNGLTRNAKMEVGRLTEDRHSRGHMTEPTDGLRGRAKVRHATDGIKAEPC